MLRQLCYGKISFIVLVPGEHSVKLSPLLRRDGQLVLVAQVVDLALLVRLIHPLRKVIGGAVLEVLRVKRELRRQSGRQGRR